MQVALEHQAEARRKQDVAVLGALAAIDKDLAGLEARYRLLKPVLDHLTLGQDGIQVLEEKLELLLIPNLSSWPQTMPSILSLTSCTDSLVGS